MTNFNHRPSSAIFLGSVDSPNYPKGTVAHLWWSHSVVSRPRMQITISNQIENHTNLLLTSQHISASGFSFRIWYWIEQISIGLLYDFYICIINQVIMQGSSRHCNRCCVYCLVPWINHWPPICLVTFRKSIFQTAVALWIWNSRKSFLFSYCVYTYIFTYIVILLAWLVIAAIITIFLLLSPFGIDFIIISNTFIIIIIIIIINDFALKNYMAI